MRTRALTRAHAHTAGWHVLLFLDGNLRNTSRRPGAIVMLARSAGSVLLLLLLPTADAQLPFGKGSDVILLDAKKVREMEKSPYIWFVNICRNS
jgi:hypothetical protein